MTAKGAPLLASHVITRLIVGGAQENTIATVLGLQNETGLHCDLISGPSQGSEGTLEQTFHDRPELLTVVPNLVRPVHPIQDGKALQTLRAIFRRTRPVIVHTHSGKAGILGRWAAHRERVPIIIHGIHGPSFGPWQGALANLAFRTAEKIAGRVTTHFIAVAQAMIDQYLAAGIGRPEKYTRIFSGFPLEPYFATGNDPVLRNKYGLEPRHLVVGKIARITPLKGHDDLLAAAPGLVRQLPHIRFLLIGGGALEETFRARTREKGMEKHFVFTGLVPPSEIPGLAGIMDLLVHLSHREGLPRALPQAMAAGKPVVAYDCDGAKEVCLPGETGFLVAPADKAGLAKAVSTLAADPALRTRLGEGGRAFVRSRFSVVKMVSDTRDLYQKMLAAHLAR